MLSIRHVYKFYKRFAKPENLRNLERTFAVGIRDSPENILYFMLDRQDGYAAHTIECK